LLSGPSTLDTKIRKLKVQQIHDNLLWSKIQAAGAINYRCALYETVTISADSFTMRAKSVHEFLTTQKNKYKQ